MITSPFNPSCPILVYTTCSGEAPKHLPEDFPDLVSVHCGFGTGRYLRDQSKLAHEFFLPGAYIYSSVHVFCIVLVLVYQLLFFFLVYLSPASINVPRPS